MKEGSLKCRGTFGDYPGDALNACSEDRNYRTFPHMLQMNELTGSIFNFMVWLGCAYDLLVWVREISSCSSPVFCHSHTGKLLKQSLDATLKQISWSQMHEMAGRDRSGWRFILGHGNTRDRQAWRKIRDTQRQAQGLSRLSRWPDNEQKTGQTQLTRGRKWKKRPG